MSDYYRLRFTAEMFWDAQQFRIALGNKKSSLTIDVDALAVKETVDRYKEIEKDLDKVLIRQYRQIVPQPVRAWATSQPGIGDHLLALLLGLVGDPYHAIPYHWEGSGKTGKNKRRLVAGDPYDRTVSQLWAYCGHGDPSRVATKGMTADEGAALGRPKAKMVVHLLAESCVKAGVRYFCEDGERFKVGDVCGHCGLVKDEHLKKAISDYGQVYLDARHHYEDQVHAAPHARCGPAGKPAPTGSPWSPGHQNGAALRKVGKTILRDLWVVARDSHIMGTPSEGAT